MSITRRTIKATTTVTAGESQLDRVRRAAALHLNQYRRHSAGGDSCYVTIGGPECPGIKIRFADHEETSRYRQKPDYNCVGRDLTEEEVVEIESSIHYPVLCKKTAFAEHVGLTVPKLKKLLDESCYEEVCENPQAYPNTYTQYVRVLVALQKLDAAGYTKRYPVAQESDSVEDWDGHRW